MLKEARSSLASTPKILIHQRREKMEDIVSGVMALGVAIAVDYLYTEGKSVISSAIPIFIFQLLSMLDKRVKRETGMGLIKFCWKKLTDRRSEGNSSN